MTTLTEMVATVVLHSSAAVFSHFGVIADVTQVSPPAAEQRVVARSPRKLDRAEKVLAKRGVISVQVLSELTSVGRRKLRMSWEELREALGTLREFCRVEPVTEQTHELALELAASSRD